MECYEILGLGGGLFAALTAIAALSKEEREHTAEFLLTHPVSRTRVVTEKLLAVILQVVLLNASRRNSDAELSKSNLKNRSQTKAS